MYKISCSALSVLRGLIKAKKNKIYSLKNKQTQISLSRWAEGSELEIYGTAVRPQKVKAVKNTGK